MKNCLIIKKFQFTSSGGPCHGMALNFRHGICLNLSLPMKNFELQGSQFLDFPKPSENETLHIIKTDACFRTLCELDTLALYCFPYNWQAHAQIKHKTQDCVVAGTILGVFQDWRSTLPKHNVTYMPFPNHWTLKLLSLGYSIQQPNPALSLLKAFLSCWSYKLLLNE